jgi:hypothetical protein
MISMPSKRSLFAFAIAVAASIGCGPTEPDVPPYQAGDVTGDPTEPSWIAVTTGMYDVSGVIALLAVGNAPVMENARTQDTQARRAATAELIAVVNGRVERIAGTCADLLASQFAGESAGKIVNREDMVSRAKATAIKLIGDPEVPGRFKCEMKTAKGVGQLWVLVRTDASSLTGAIRETLMNDINQIVIRNTKSLTNPNREEVLAALTKGLDSDLASWLAEKQPSIELP